MTTPDTAAVRAWARENGLAVSDRGRLPAEVYSAYASAQGSSARTAARKAAKAPATPANAARRQAAARPSTASATTAGTDAPADAPAVPDQVAARVAALEEQLAALTARVFRLEQTTPVPGPAPDASRPSMFRRRSR